MACVFFCLERKWGSMAQIFRVERTKNFTVMSNHHFKNKKLNQSLQKNNDDLRNRNGLKSRREQEQLEEEIKDVRGQNSKLQIQVNKSSVQAVDEAYKKQKEAEKQLQSLKYQVEQNRKIAEKGVQKLKKRIS